LEKLSGLQRYSNPGAIGEKRPQASVTLQSSGTNNHLNSYIILTNERSWMKLCGEGRPGNSIGGSKMIIVRFPDGKI
jgi:hypothetical protein